MTLGNMRQQGVQHLIGFCHNDACRHSALIDVSSYVGHRFIAARQHVSSTRC
jgi:hypothetical protein